MKLEYGQKKTQFLLFYHIKVDRFVFNLLKLIKRFLEILHRQIIFVAIGHFKRKEAKF